MSDDPETYPERPAREPLFNVPWIIVALIASLIATHALRTALHVGAEGFAFTSDDLARRHWGGLLSYLFTHGSWPHVLMNSAAILAFGPPTARMMGEGARGAGAFLGFFFACGVVAALGYAALHMRGEWALVGASGAASGLMAAAARLIDGQGRVGPLFGRTTIGMTVAWIAINVLLGASGLTPGAAGLPVAWDAHIVGYFAGLFAIVPFAWMAGSRTDHVLED